MAKNGEYQGEVERVNAGGVKREGGKLSESGRSDVRAPSDPGNPIRRKLSRTRNEKSHVPSSH